MKKILVVAGTRPNFIKIALFKKAAAGSFDLRIVHTGQHFDANLSDIFFEQLGIYPDYKLAIESQIPALQILEIRNKLIALIGEYFLPDMIILVGDVNSTRAGAEAAQALNITAAHVESGLRSFDDSMPEEYNRIFADGVSRYHFVTEKSGVENLEKEGYDATTIFFVGNTMIDTLIAFDEQIQNNQILDKLKLQTGQFALVTIHRPSNVDTPEVLRRSIDLLNAIATDITVIFPIHPRTSGKLKEWNLIQKLTGNKNIICSEPLGYFEFQKLISACKFIITDSGGIQEEATFRKKPCITIRPNTERPSTTEIGSNTLLNWDTYQILKTVDAIRRDQYKKSDIPPLWDGRATERIFQVLSRLA